MNVLGHKSQLRASDEISSQNPNFEPHYLMMNKTLTEMARQRLLEIISFAIIRWGNSKIIHFYNVLLT